MSKLNILVTGNRRGGTTFLGKMLSLDKEISYIHEPFNYEQGLKGISIKSWFPYLTKNNISNVEKKLLDDFIKLKNADSKVSLGDNKTNKFKYDVEKKDIIKNLFFNYYREPLIYRIQRIAVKNMFYASFLMAKYNPLSRRLLIKDPCISLSSNYICNEYDFRVIVVIRHPAAHFYSMKKKNWGIPPENFLVQKDLMRDYLSEFDNDLKTAKTQEDRAILEWLCVNKVLFHYVEKNKNIILIKHEDLSLNPLEALCNLYNTLDIPFTEKVKKIIINYTHQNNKTETFDNILNVKRSSSEIIDQWKKKLTQNEIKRVKEKTFHLAKKYYSEECW